MRTFLIGLTGATALLFAAPANAQDFGFRFGDVGVHVDTDRDHGWRHHGRRYGQRFGRDCREVTMRKRLRDGSVLIRKSYEC